MASRFLLLPAIVTMCYAQSLEEERIPALGDIGQVCRGTVPSEGGCLVDGSGCEGDLVNFSHYQMNVSAWDAVGKKNRLVGTTPSYAIAGEMDTWQMYLHGPLLRIRERPFPNGIPPLYTHATWTNKIYRFDFLSEPQPGKTLFAKQKLVGWADAPSTSYPIEAPDGTLKGLMVAEGQPFWLSIYGGMKPPFEVGKGGVSVLPNEPEAKCNKIFPKNWFHKMFGQVVNTVDCHKRLGICFFTVWKFYDDQKPIWGPISQMIAPDCLYYCIVNGTEDNPGCSKVDVVVDESGQKVCHKDGVGAVHGMTIGLDDAQNKDEFDIFLIFTGEAQFTKGESSMKKVKVQVSTQDSVAGNGNGTALAKQFQVLNSSDFALDLFKGLPPTGLDAGGDHAWVDETGTWIWVSTFRTGAPGVHMVRYSDGALMYSVTGLDSYLPHQYLYSAGIHGIGTVGKRGSYIAVATSACSKVEACAPIPWIAPTKVEPGWARAVQFVIDIGKISPPRADLNVYV